MKKGLKVRCTKNSSAILTLLFGKEKQIVQFCKTIAGLLSIIMNVGVNSAVLKWAIKLE
jgi:hypothetical protein